MGRFGWIQCPDCGWTGRLSELDEQQRDYCPNCDASIQAE